MDVNNKPKEVEFEHIWLDKINIQNLQTDRWFKELVEDFMIETIAKFKSGRL